jgi:hypothetical protein
LPAPPKIFADDGYPSRVGWYHDANDVDHATPVRVGYGRVTLVLVVPRG